MKVYECQGDPSKVWCVAKKFMAWKSAGPPSQLEVQDNGKLELCSKASSIAQIMNHYFISHNVGEIL